MAHYWCWWSFTDFLGSCKTNCSQWCNSGRLYNDGHLSFLIVSSASIFLFLSPHVKSPFIYCSKLNVPLSNVFVILSLIIIDFLKPTCLSQLSLNQSIPQSFISSVISCLPSFLSLCLLGISFYATMRPSSFHPFSFLICFFLLPTFLCLSVLSLDEVDNCFSLPSWPLLTIGAHHCCASPPYLCISLHLFSSPLHLPSPFLSHRPLILPYIHSVGLISCVSVPNLCARTQTQLT